MKRKSKALNNSFRSSEMWMLRALTLAEKGRLSVSPNPMVGACLVKNGTLIGEGYHRAYGDDHAEVMAFKKAGKKAKGATLYVTLEPCTTYGKTPPCVDAVIESGVREVVVGSLDPNPLHQGKGIAMLRKAGIRVSSGVLSAEVQKQNESFFKFMKTRRPFVTLKMAQSLDGKIATREGHARWISSQPAREFVHRLRAEQDAILVGTGTLKQDDPKLSPSPFPSPRMRGEGRERGSTKPWRVVLDPRFEVSPKARIFEGKQLTILAVSEKIAKTKAMQKKKIPTAILLPVKEQKGRLDLQDLMKKLASLGVAKLLVEGGGEAAWSFVEQKLVDKLYWIIAPKFIGGRNAKTSLEGNGVRLATDAFSVQVEKQKMLGEDFLIEGKLK